MIFGRGKRVRSVLLYFSQSESFFLSCRDRRESKNKIRFWPLWTCWVMIVGFSSYVNEWKLGFTVSSLPLGLKVTYLFHVYISSIPWGSVSSTANITTTTKPTHYNWHEVSLLLPSWCWDWLHPVSGITWNSSASCTRCSGIQPTSITSCKFTSSWTHTTLA